MCPSVFGNIRHHFWAAAWSVGPRWRLIHRHAELGGSSIACRNVPDPPHSRCWARQHCAGSFSYGKWPLPHPPISGLGRYLMKVCGCLWYASPELVDECLVHGAIGEGAHYVASVVSGSSFLFWENHRM